MMEDFNLPTGYRKQRVPFTMLPFLPAPRWRIISALLTVLVVCGIIWAWNTQLDRIENKLSRQEAVWNEQGIDDYEYNIFVAHFSVFYRGKVTVRSGKVVEINPGLEKHAPWRQEDFSMDGLFDEALKQASIFQGVDVKLTFDKKYGIPEYIETGRFFVDSMSGESWTPRIEVSDFKILE